MSGPHVAIISRDPATRRAAAIAFEDAPRDWVVTLHDEPVPADVIVCEAALNIPGALVLDPERPTQTYSEVARRLAGAKGGSRTYVVTGAGGGVGATTIALHLSAALATQHRCCFVDLDVAWGAASRFDLDRSSIKTWGQVGSDGESLRLAALPLRGGFRALLAPSGSDLPPDLLDRTRATFTRLVIDAPVDSLDAALIEATAVVVVVGSTRPAAQRAIPLLERIGERPTALILNRTAHGGALSAEALGAAVGRKVTLELPPTPSLRDAEDEAKLLIGPWCRFARRMQVLATALERA